MENDTPKKSKAIEDENKDELVQPDPETLHTTDPQEHMKGPLSSLVQDIKKEAEKDDSPGTPGKDR